jgi:hypothetical protein
VLHRLIWPAVDPTSYLSRQTTYKVPSFPFGASLTLFSLHFMSSPSSFSASQSWFSLHLMSSPPSFSASQSWFSLRFMSSPPYFNGVPIVHFVRFQVFALLVPCGDVLYDFRVFTPICLVRGSCFFHVLLCIYVRIYRCPIRIPVAYH